MHLDTNIYNTIREGVTKPVFYMGRVWTYHVEDINIHSINYNHKGSTKIWYDVCKKYAESFLSMARSVLVP